MKASKKQENQKCPFDPTHIVPKEALEKHIIKCKSPNKMNFQQCKYNPMHWVNYTKIDQHQRKCQLQANNFTVQEDYSDIIGLVDQLGGMNDKSKMVQKSSFMSRNTKKKMKELEEEEPKNKLWEEPDFGRWYEKFKKKTPNINNISNFNDSSQFSNDSQMMSFKDF